MKTLFSRTTMVAAVVAAATLACATGPADAQQAAPEKIKVAYLRTLAMAHHWQAEKMGAFKKEGLEIELVVLNNGPAVASAIASGSADIGFAASTPMISAIGQNQPFKVFMTNNTEKHPSQWVQQVLATDKSGVKSVADLKGKTVIINAAGAACELSLRGNLAAAGLKYDDVKTVILPFPQHAPALERGDGDATCNVEPFLSLMRLGGKLKLTPVINGMVAGMDKLGEVVIDGYFARSDWLAKNGKVAAAFKRAMEETNVHFGKNLPEYRGWLTGEFKLPQAVAEAIAPEIKLHKLDAKPAEWQPVIDSMHKHGMIPQPIKAADIIFTFPR